MELLSRILNNSEKIKDKELKLKGVDNKDKNDINPEVKKLLNAHNIDPNEKVINKNENANGDIVYDGKTFPANSSFIPQSLLKTTTGKAASYSIANGDYFAGITILCEGVRSNAFYEDPASRKGKFLLNTHPGITLSHQSNSEIDKIFAKTSLSGKIEEQVKNDIQQKNMSQRLKNEKLSVSDYYNMFGVIKGKYTKGVDDALVGSFKNNKLAQAHGGSNTEILKEIKKNLPAPAYATLQQLSYKYGPTGMKKFKSLLNSAVNAGLDVENQDKHLEDGSKHIVYQYKNKNNQVIQDTRVMNIHRLFYTSGVKFSQDLNLKLILGEKLTNDELKNVQNVAKKAGISNIINDSGEIDFKDGTEETAKNDDSYKIELDINASEKGVKNVQQVNILKLDTEPDISEISNKISQPKNTKQEHQFSDNIGMLGKNIKF